jgi:hypothetical protein
VKAHWGVEVELYESDPGCSSRSLVTILTELPRLHTFSNTNPKGNALESSVYIKTLFNCTGFIEANEGPTESDEHVKMWKETVVVYFTILAAHMLAERRSVRLAGHLAQN